MLDDGEPLLSSTLLLTLAEDMLWHVVAVLDADLFPPTRLVCRRLKQIVDEVAERTQVVDVLAESLEDIVCFDSLNLFYPSAPLSSRFLDLLPTCGMQRFNHLMHSLAQLVPRFGDVLDVATFKPDSCLRGRGLCRLRSRRGSDQRRWPRAAAPTVRLLALRGACRCHGGGAAGLRRGGEGCTQRLETEREKREKDWCRRRLKSGRAG